MARSFENQVEQYETVMDSIEEGIKGMDNNKSKYRLRKKILEETRSHLDKCK